MADKEQISKDDALKGACAIKRAVSNAGADSNTPARKSRAYKNTGADSNTPASKTRANKSACVKKPDVSAEPPKNKGVKSSNIKKKPPATSERLSKNTKKTPIISEQTEQFAENTAKSPPISERLPETPKVLAGVYVKKPKKKKKAPKFLSEKAPKKPTEKPKTDKQLSEEIKNSLTKQLAENGANVTHFASLIDDYIFYWLEERKAQNDIIKLGMTYQTVSATGKIYEKENPAIKNAVMYNKQKLSILKELGLSADKCTKPFDAL